MNTLQTVTPSHAYTQAERFLRALDPDAATFTFQCFPEKGQSGGAPWSHHGTLTEAWQTIERRNQSGQRQGAFVAINETSVAKCKVEDITRVRALFIDCDDAETSSRAAEIIRAAGLKPSMIVKSSGGKTHFYWLVDDVGLEEFKGLQQSLAAKFGSDPAVCNLNRVMRLPGTLHLKGDPHPVQLHVRDTPSRYTKAQIVAAFGLDRTMQTGSNVVPSPGPVQLTDEWDEASSGIERASWFDALDDGEKDAALKEMLAALPDWSMGTRQNWMKGLMAACRSGAPNAEDIARDWSALYPQFSDAEFDKQWSSIGPAGPGQTGIGTIIKEASNRNPTLVEKWRATADAHRVVAGVSGEVLAPERRQKSKYARAIEYLNKLDLEIKHDTFSDVTLVGNKPGSNVLPNNYCGVLNDHALVFLRGTILTRYNFDTGSEAIFDAAKMLATEHRFNPVTDWLDGLVWDGTNRLKAWLPQVTGAGAIPLHGAIGAWTILAMVARMRYPGTKYDVCLVLEGAQGLGKSTLAKILSQGPGEGYFTDAPGILKMDTKARGELLAGKLVVELGELSGLAKSDVEEVKALLSQSSDKYRPAYGRCAIEQQRTCLMIGSTNGTSYLQDVTGNRRFLPVACTKIDVPAFQRIRDQLFAEADHILKRMAEEGRKAGMSIRDGKPLPDGIAAKLALPQSLWQAAADAADTRRAPDLLEEMLPDIMGELEKDAPVLPDGRKGVAFKGVLDRLNAISSLRVAPNRVADLLRRMGWEMGARIRIDGKQARYCVRV